MTTKLINAANNPKKGILSLLHHHETIFIFLAGFLYAQLLFCFVYGTAILNPLNTQWLLAGGDLSQHYIGWVYYRDTPWLFPLGLTEGLITPERSSVIFTDSIPLFALFCKILSPILPNQFQYFGIYGILSFGLMGGFSSILVNRFISRPAISLVISTCFILSPYVLQRMFEHTALAGQWLIVAALFLWLTRPFANSFLKDTLAWIALFVVACGIHLYLAAMVGLILIAKSLNDQIEGFSLRQNLTRILSTFVAGLFWLWLLGAFYGNSAQDTGLGYFSANINSLFNPQGFSLIYSDLPILPGQYEGFGYLGAGFIVLLLIAAYKIIAQGIQLSSLPLTKNQIIFLAISALFFFLLALSPIATLGEVIGTQSGVKTLYVLPLPDSINSLLSIFRSSGRFIWPACYIVMLVSIIIVFADIKLNRKILPFVFSVLIVGIQIYDLSGALNDIRHNDKFSDSPITKIENADSWNNLLKEHNHVKFLTDGSLIPNTPNNFYIALKAHEYGGDLNKFYIARAPKDAIYNNDQILRENLKKGIVDNDALYIFDRAQDLVENDSLSYFQLGEYIILVDEKHDELIELGASPILN